MQAHAGIYLIRNLITGRVYVGQSINIANRWRQHCDALRKGKHKTPRLQQSWNKHGEAAFMFEIIELVEDVTSLDFREQ
jgi:group I intron endonuclease